MTLLEIVFIYSLGAVGYGAIETFWRGHTHWTMLVLGGFCFLGIYLVTIGLHIPLLLKWLLCAALVTVLEFGTGCLVNLYLGWNVWDYSGLAGNLLGQICPAYTLWWFLLSIPCSGLAWAIRNGIFSHLTAHS